MKMRHKKMARSAGRTLRWYAHLTYLGATVLRWEEKYKNIH